MLTATLTAMLIFIATLTLMLIFTATLIATLKLVQSLTAMLISSWVLGPIVRVRILTSPRLTKKISTAF